jgi:hypothetical protein
MALSDSRTSCPFSDSELCAFFLEARTGVKSFVRTRNLFHREGVSQSSVTVSLSAV